MSTEVQTVGKVDNLPGGAKRKHKDAFHRKHHSEEAKFFKFSKKRSQSFSGKVGPPYKKRKKEKLIPPTKFLLGGNIRDPLNLNSLQDEEVNRRANAFTPESSPLPTPKHRKGVVEVIIPADIHDPLALNGDQDDDEAYAASFNVANPVTPRKVRKKNRKRRSRGGHKDEANDSGPKPDPQKSEQSDLSGELAAAVSEEKKKQDEKEAKEKEKEKKEKDFKRPKLGGLEKKDKKIAQDKIVSPVIPQPGAWPGTGRYRKQGRRPNQPTPKFKETGRKFQYGNYNRYYGYRNPGHEVDPRLKVFSRYPHFFAGKDILDIGSNIGLVSISVARDLGARSVVGIDIDKNLVDIARQRLRRSSKEFPPSMPLVYGPLDVPGIQEANTFPHNLTFIQGNYVLESDVLVELEQAQFDTILCLSVTKWFHLNWGDAGLKRAFKRMYTQLRPGGILILEPQDWPSYKKRKTLTEVIWRNYQSIKLLPAMFTEYLLTEVGFSKCEVISTPLLPQKGFQRLIKVFTKGETPLNRTPRTEIGSVGGGSTCPTPRDEPSTSGFQPAAAAASQEVEPGDVSQELKSGATSQELGASPKVEVESASHKMETEDASQELKPAATSQKAETGDASQEEESGAPLEVESESASHKMETKGASQELEPAATSKKAEPGDASQEGESGASLEVEAESASHKMETEVASLKTTSQAIKPADSSQVPDMP